MKRDMSVSIRGVENGYIVTLNWYECKDLPVGGTNRIQEWVEHTLVGAISKANAFLENKDG